MDKLKTLFQKLFMDGDKFSKLKVDAFFMGIANILALLDVGFASWITNNIELINVVLGSLAVIFFRDTLGTLRETMANGN